MIALLLAISSWPVCAPPAMNEAKERPWASPRCEVALPALARLAEAAEQHGSVRTHAWARAALADRLLRCPGAGPLAFTPALSWRAPGPVETDSWRWLADVGSREEALELIAAHLGRPSAHWSWAFAWVELTRADCPGSARACARFRALREGDWAELRRRTEGSITREDVLLHALALELTGEHGTAVELLRAHPRGLAYNTHPLTEALEALGTRILASEPLERRLETVDALEPGHALRALTHSPARRVPLKNEHFTPLFAD